MEIGMGNSPLKIAARQGGAQQASPRQTIAHPGGPASREYTLNEETFCAMLAVERRRAERSRKPFLLMLIDSGVAQTNGRRDVVERLAPVVSGAIRESDILGWYRQSVVLGIIFTELSQETNAPLSEALRGKIVKALRENLGQRLTSQLSITLHLFPETWDGDSSDRAADVKLYPDVSRKLAKKPVPTLLKRVMDILGSVALLLIISPLLAVIALAIKLTSKGPVIFKQERLGQLGKPFPCLKFRTMYTDNSPKIHRDYVRSFIAGKVNHENKSESEPVVYKLKNDPRVTPVGRFLRRMSLDELPQFWNVLCGEMSLVGPRPPVSYEFEAYDLWHRRRVFEVKPGVTGLWQVSGRSRTSFDDMVRLDLRYVQRWSLWLDLKILLVTPKAVFTGDGAY
jgi:lipopolysaccharide/colanic/teichoic acid biosynthesis glycosyltransferase